ncbi:hypothetical protein Q5Y75_15985 [Ruegeria sp. 2205SS24-7]|uniref:hypothetical protein n=1 Tax=Ruegeria discodermiae TaxID=3064389 RepID=UPI00274176AE|nr:hypothetical protein [Ruegeria sp. 2205SS24-7]MDP5218729.1 hypothetical protein [Ruegeria sp. 2205SS24-7]
MNDKVCLITGVCDATGASVARRFARDGYRVALLAENAVKSMSSAMNAHASIT